ncbi:oxidoreductase-like protein [Staphylotrichum tortipilum]|uniref:Oxidoreductase-like protein n=1 Tax=Staphylotrichum tortipilum TaxID=2831512 RepID=A0AAN6RPX2_9PEZI|nr:oxidoreductase-like protein [Staphylotrichum longicolle]
MPKKGFLGMGRLGDGLRASREDRGPQYVIEAIDSEMGKDVHTVAVPMFGYQLIVSRDPTNIQHVLAGDTDHWDISEHRAESWKPLVGHGIFTSRGMDWRTSRGLVRPQFAKQQIYDLDLFERHVQLLFGAIDKHSTNDDVDGSKGWTAAFDLQPLFYNFTLDVVTEMLFGYSAHSQDPSKRFDIPDFALYGAPDFENIGKHMDAGKAWIETRGAFWKYRWLLPSGQFKKHCRALHEFADWFVRRCIRLGDQFLDELEKHPGGIPNSERFVLLHELSKVTHDREELRSQPLNILTAGRDTTAALLGWIFYFLCRHPEVWDKLRDEVIKLFGPYVPGKPSRTDPGRLLKMPYMMAVVNETLRMAPVVPLNDRVAVHHTVLPTGGGPNRDRPIFVPKGTQILIPTYALGMRPDDWGHDTVHKYLPERWMEPDRTCGLGYEFIPFGGGVRQCLGRKYFRGPAPLRVSMLTPASEELARLKTAYVVVRILQRYDRADCTEVPRDAPIRFHHTIENRSGTGVQPAKMLIQTTPPNKTLKGHKLLAIAPWPEPPSHLFRDRLSSAFPDLEIVYHQLRFAAGRSDPEVAKRGADGPPWEGATIVLTFRALPEPEEAEGLVYVQLMSAGADQLRGRRIFEEGGVGGREVGFCTANGVHGPQISEWVISTYLAFEHRLPKYLEQQKAAHWDAGDLMTIEDAASKKIGILGYGSIGRQTARVAAAMGMTVHAYTLHPRPTPESRRDHAWTPPGLGDPEGTIPSKWFSGGSTAELHEFLGSGLDLLVVAAPLTEKTQHILGREEFRLLAEKNGKGKTFVSNIGRGPVVDTDALVDALEEGLVRGAALDVTDPEPLPDGHKLWGAKNVIITPHVSGASVRYFERVVAILEENLGRLVEGRELVNKVDPKRGY